jgi:pyruvate dehydrogenase E1 component beta subunit
VKEELPERTDRVEIGAASVENEGRDISLISYGAMMKECREAVKRLTDDGISVELIDLRTLTPLDVDVVLDSVRKTSRAVLVSEAPRTAGFMSEVSAIISERAMFSLTAPVRRLTGLDTVFPLKRSESLYLPSTDRIVSALRSTLEASV